MSNLDKVRATLRALKAKTVANGCTEEEALAAADKMAELLSRHGLSQTDLDDEGFDETEVNLGRRSPLDDIWFSVGVFADCNPAYSRRSGKLCMMYFGRPQDVLVAQYVHEVLKAACDKALKDFRAGPIYARRRTNKTRAQAVKAFQEGLALQLVRKVRAALWQRYWTADSATTKAAIAATKTLLLEGAATKGYSFHKPRDLAPVKTPFAADAERSGAFAGAAIDVHAGVGSSGTKVTGLLK